MDKASTNRRHGREDVTLSSGIKRSVRHILIPRYNRYSAPAYFNTVKAVADVARISPAPLAEIPATINAPRRYHKCPAASPPSHDATHWKSSTPHRGRGLVRLTWQVSKTVRNWPCLAPDPQSSERLQIGGTKQA